MLDTDGLMRIFGDTRFLIEEAPTLKDAWLNFYVMAPPA